MKLLFVCLLFFSFKSDASIKIPDIYINGEKEIVLVVSFNCFYCRQALYDLLNYLKTKPKVRAKIYYFLLSADDAAKIILMLAAENDLELIVQLYDHFLSSYNWQIKRFLKRNPKLLQKLEKSRKQYERVIFQMQHEICEQKIGAAPTWIFNNTYHIEGLFKDFDQILLG